MYGGNYSNTCRITGKKPEQVSAFTGNILQENRKPWDTLNEEEKVQRIKDLWKKLRRWVIMHKFMQR